MDHHILSAFLILVILAPSAISFALYLFRRKNGKRAFSALALGVCLASVVIYSLVLLGWLSTPLPSVVGRNLVLGLAILVGISAIGIWRW